MNMPNMNPLLRLHAIGQRIWLDNLSRTLLQEGAGRQDHIGQVSSLCQKDVLDHQVLQCGQGLARVVGIGV